MVHYDTCIDCHPFRVCLHICSIKCVDIKACFSYAIECSLDVPVCHIVAFYLAAHYHVPLVSLSVLELKAFSCWVYLSLSYIYLLIGVWLAACQALTIHGCIYSLACPSISISTCGCSSVSHHQMWSVSWLALHINLTASILSAHSLSHI